MILLTRLSRTQKGHCGGGHAQGVMAARKTLPFSHREEKGVMILRIRIKIIEFFDPLILVRFSRK